MERMGDSRRIDHLRALALSSMPSLARRPAHFRNSGVIDIFEQRKTLLSALPVVPDDKEEGELSSDDEIERTATPSAAVETSLSFAHRNAGLSLRPPTQGNLKDERHTCAATSAESERLLGVSSASVFSTSTRVSIVNKSQLFSAFTAQAPPLISPQAPEPEPNGSGVGLAVKRLEHSLPEVTSSGAPLNISLSHSYHGASRNSLQTSSTAPCQLIPTLPNLALSQASRNSPNWGTSAQNSLGVTGLPGAAPFSSAVLPSHKRPNIPTATVDVTKAASPIPAPVTASGGADLSKPLGTASAVSVFGTPAVGSTGLRKEAGVRKEAEAFLASLRIPVANSAASGDEKERAFLIKFDEDSDSDGENEGRTNSIVRNPERSSRKGTTSSVGPVTASAPLQLNPVMQNQSPADLTAEIEHIKKQIAAMERTKGKTAVPSVSGKATKAHSTDTSRNVVLPATEPRAGIHLAPADLESMRLKIAAKESELRQRRQRLAVKVPENGRGVSDPKRGGGVLASSLPPTVRSSQTADSAAAQTGYPIEKPSSEKGIPGYKKEVQARADGIPALALAGPMGANLADFKKDGERRLLDGCNEHLHLNGPASNATAVQGSHVSRATGQQLLPKGMKRSRPGGEICELAKVPRLDTSVDSEKSFAKDSSKEVALPFNANDTLQGGRNALSTVQTSKRKVDAAPGSSVDVIVANSGSEPMKKLKTNSGGGLSGSRPYVGEELRPNSKQNPQMKDQQAAAQNISPHDGLLSTVVPREKGNSTLPNNNTSLKSPTGAVLDKVDGNVGIRDTEPASSLSDPLPLVIERQRASSRFQKSAGDVLTSSNVIRKFGTNGNADALQIQQATGGPEISPGSQSTFGDAFSEPNVKPRDREQTAVLTTAAGTERQQETVGRLNPNPTVSTENNRVQTAQLWKPVAATNSVPATNWDYRQLDGEPDSFQQLLEEEELLDKQLEEVQRIRQRCEIRERNARREYREAQLALRAANVDCYTLNQRKELLLSRMHAAEARDLSVNSYIDRPLVPFGGTLVTHNQSRPEHSPLLVTTPYPVRVSQALEISWQKDVNIDPGRSAQVRESLSPFSSDRVDLGAVAQRNAEEAEENSRYKSAKSISSDDKEYESHGQLTGGVESSGRLEHDSAVGDEKVQDVFVNVERQKDLEPGIVVDGASHAENQAYIRSESELNIGGSRSSPCAGSDSVPEVFYFPAEGRKRVVTRTNLSETRADEFPQGTLLEEIEQVPWITAEGAKRIQEPCSVVDISGGGPRMGELPAVCAQDERHPVLGLHQDLPQLTGKDLEQEGSEKEHHDVEQVTACSSSQDAQSVDSLRSPLDSLQDVDTTEVQEFVNTGVDSGATKIQESLSMGDVKLTRDDGLQDDLTENVSSRRYEDDAAPIHLKDRSIGASAMTFASTDYGGMAGNQDVSVASMSEECALRVPTERSYAVLEDGLLENEVKAVEFCARTRAYAKDVPFDPEVEAVLCSLSHNVPEASGARDGIGRSNLGTSVEVPHDSDMLNSDPEQSSSLLVPSAVDTSDEKEPNPLHGDFADVQKSDATLLETDQEPPVILGNSSSKDASPHHVERKALATDESIEGMVSARVLSDDAMDAPVSQDWVMESPEGVPGGHPAGDVEWPVGGTGRESSLAPPPGSQSLNLQEGWDCRVSSDDCLVAPPAESTYVISDNGLTEHSPTTINHVDHNTFIVQNQYCQPPSEERDAHFDNSTATQLADARNFNKTGMQDFADIIEEEHLDTSDVLQKRTLKMSLIANVRTEALGNEEEDPVPGTSGDPGRIDSQMIPENSEALSQNEFGSQDHNLTLSSVAEDYQQDQWRLDMPDSGEQEQNDPGGIESQTIIEKGEALIQNDFGSENHDLAKSLVPEDQQQDQWLFDMSESGEQKQEDPGRVDSRMTTENSEALSQKEFESPDHDLTMSFVAEVQQEDQLQLDMPESGEQIQEDSGVSQMITENSKALSQNESGTQDQNLTMALVVEDQQQDQLLLHVSESGEQKQEDRGRIGSQTITENSEALSQNEFESQDHDLTTSLVAEAQRDGQSQFYMPESGEQIQEDPGRIVSETITENSEALSQNEFESQDHDLTTSFVAEVQQEDQSQLDMPESGEQIQEDAGTIVSQMITENSEALRQNEFGSQDHNLTMSFVAEDQQQDQLQLDVAESWEQMQEDPGRIVSQMIIENSEALRQTKFGAEDHNLTMSLVAEDQQQDQLQSDMSESGEQKQEEPGRIGSQMITENSEALSQNEFGSPDHDLTMSFAAEDQQKDQLQLDMPEAGEQKQEDPEKKESKGADVEVFRKALLDGNVFERRASSCEVADTTNFNKQARDEVPKQILPHHHRLEHLLDMVEVREPELPNGGDTLVRESLQGEKYAGSRVPVDDLQLDSPPPESHDTLVQSRAQALSSRTTSENDSDTAKHWVPSADSLAVLSFVPRVVEESPSGTSCEMENTPSDKGSLESFGNSVVLPYRYESPLSIFRSYRIFPQFSDNLHLSRSSTTWSHAINPFKPLCKFEHRGKCNNDDCPWQHTDDYTLSSSQIMSQIQNYVDTRGDSPVIATMAKAPLAGCTELLQNSSTGPVSSRLKWNGNEVPIYRTGSYTLRAEDPSGMSLLSRNLQLGRKVESLHSFLLSPSIHRPLPPDVPCLLEASETSSWFREAPTYHPGSPHWRYMRDVQEKLMCTKDGGELQEVIDEEMWLELALHQIDYDISNDNKAARDQALFYLSRALEKKRSSVTLWVVYSCLFHMRKDNEEKDDMFHHAVQYNPGSYELWILYINSRSDFQARLAAYKTAIVGLASEGIRLQLDEEELSACMLDIGLQMLYFWCVSSSPEECLSWVEDLIRDAFGKDDVVRPRGRSTTALLSYLTQHDACVLWIACTYLLACKHLPDSIITRLGCKQELPDGLEWEKHAMLDEESHKSAMRALSTAASEGLGCLYLGSAEAVDDNADLPKQVLGVNYIQCLALYEGLDSAAAMGKKLISLHPTSLELIVVCARIEERRNGFTTGLHVFEEAVLQWPRGLPGMQRLWNQYAGHALLWGGKDLAKTVLLDCAVTRMLTTMDEVEVPQWVSSQIDGPDSSRGNATESWSNLREYFVTLTPVSKRTDGGTSSGHQLCQGQDTVFALINLALVDALSGDIPASQSEINSAMKAAVSHKDLRHCWRELAAFYQAFCSKPAGSGNSKLLEHSMVSLFDRCKTDSFNLSQLRPLSEKAFQNYKKPHVRKFLETLMGPPPLDHSVLNSILGTLYGPQLLPSDSYPLKEVFHFAEGILESLPGNFRLASSLCKIVSENRSALKRTYFPAVMWASALLTSSLHQSCPVAPEVYWVEAGSLVRQLDDGISLEEFYKLALVKYPFSAALRRRLQEVQDRLRVPDAAPSLPVQHKSRKFLAAEPIQVAVEC